MFGNKDWMERLKKLANQNSCADLISILNFIPTLAGFPLLSNEFNVLFWLLHTILSFYVYISGTIVYQTYYAKEFIDLVNSVFNIFVFMLIIISAWWLLLNRSALNNLLNLAQKNDDFVTESGRLSDEHLRLLKKIRKIVIICYIFHIINGVFLFIPSRTVNMDDLSLASCHGLHPLTSNTDRIICTGILAAQELTSMVAVSTYDATLLFLFTHTTAVFQILYEDMTDFNQFCAIYSNSTSDIVARLRCLVRRHSLVMHTVQKMQEFYSVPIGIGFGVDVISMCVFFVLPWDLCLNFAPLVYYSAFMFFLYCYVGQRLTTASEKFETAVYCCGWENLRAKEQKIVLLMLKQAQNPVIMVAAGFIPICIRTFAITMQHIYKFVTVFKI